MVARLMRHANDYYPTPMSLAIPLINCLWDVDYIWEPCAGDGRLVQLMRDKGYVVSTGDIVTGQDFFDVEKAPCNTLVTNPPFRDVKGRTIRHFIDHAFDIGVERMALVCPERLWSCKVGLQQLRRHRPTRFINCSWREDYLQLGGSPDRMLAVSIWDAPHANSCSFDVWDKPNV